jgi:hypothetical protein
MTVGPLIPADSVPQDSADATLRLKAYIEGALSADSEARFA